MKQLLLLLPFVLMIKDPCLAQTCQASFTWTQTGPNTITFTNTSTGTNLNTMYNYSFGDSQYGFTQNPVHVYSSASTYLVCLVIYDSAMCQSTFCDTIIVQNSQGIDDIPAVVESHLFPNPAQSNANLELTLNLGSTLSIQIMDLSGKEVLPATDGNFSAGKHTFQFNTSMLESGLYMIRLSNGSGVITKKLTVMH